MSVQTTTDSPPKKQYGLPNFAAWNTHTLVNFAAESYVRILEQQEALEQLRHDLRDAMNKLREQLNKDDWK